MPVTPADGSCIFYGHHLESGRMGVITQHSIAGFEMIDLNRFSLARKEVDDRCHVEAKGVGTRVKVLWWSVLETKIHLEGLLVLVEGDFAEADEVDESVLFRKDEILGKQTVSRERDPWVGDHGVVLIEAGRLDGRSLKGPVSVARKAEDYRFNVLTEDPVQFRGGRAFSTHEDA